MSSYKHNTQYNCCSGSELRKLLLRKGILIAAQKTRSGTPPVPGLCAAAQGGGVPQAAGERPASVGSPAPASARRARPCRKLRRCVPRRCVRSRPGEDCPQPGHGPRGIAGQAGVRSGSTGEGNGEGSAPWAPARTEPEAMTYFPGEPSACPQAAVGPGPPNSPLHQKKGAYLERKMLRRSGRDAARASRGRGVP